MRERIDDGLVVGMYFIRANQTSSKIQILGLTAEAMTYRIVEPLGDAVANPNNLTVHRPTFARQVSEGSWIEVTS